MDDLAGILRRATMRRDPLWMPHRVATRRACDEENRVCRTPRHGCSRVRRLRQPGSHSRCLDCSTKTRTIAPPGFNRWLVPPAALCIHLCIGMAYGFSVFWLPLTRAWASRRRSPARSRWASSPKLTTTTCDWDKPLLGWMYTLFFVFLGSSAAMFGTLARAGRAAQGGIGLGHLLVWRPGDLGGGRVLAPALAALAGRRA